MSKNRKVLEKVYGGRYNRIYALKADYYSICYYCGDFMNELDHVPPLQAVEFFIATKESADFFLVPSCHECNLLGSSEPHGILEVRAEYIREKLKRRYQKQWKQIHLWSKSEVDALVDEEGETNITRSLQAIVNSESDLTYRLQFQGYPFEVRGGKHYMNYEPQSRFEVFGNEFVTFKDALQYSIDSYKVKAEVLYNYAVGFGGDLEKALNKMFLEQEELIKNKDIEELSKKIAEEYSTTQSWVFRSLKSLRNSNPTASVNELRMILTDKYLKNA